MHIYYHANSNHLCTYIILSYWSLIHSILAEPEEWGRLAILRGIDKWCCLTVPDGYSLYHLVNDFCCGKLYFRSVLGAKARNRNRLALKFSVNSRCFCIFTSLKSVVLSVPWSHLCNQRACCLPLGASSRYRCAGEVFTLSLHVFLFFILPLRCLSLIFLLTLINVVLLESHDVVESWGMIESHARSLTVQLWLSNVEQPHPFYKACC
jgi:hypothetical protein